jgi:hypothetical protein
VDASHWSAAGEVVVGEEKPSFYSATFSQKKNFTRSAKQSRKVSNERLPRRFERLIVGSSTAKALESRLQRRAPPLPNNITSD